MTSERSSEIAAWLLRKAGPDPSTAQVVSSIVATCQDIDGTLTPIIGSRGMAALLHRSVHLAGQSQPLLARMPARPASSLDLAGLQQRLAGQAPADAAAAGGVLLHTLYELLGTLIGTSLTERLLRSVWPHLSNSTPQDTRP